MNRFITAITSIATTIAINAATFGTPAPQSHTGADDSALRLPGKSISITKTSQQGLSRINRAAENDNEVFFESFEYPESPGYWNESTANLAWLPEGWTRESHSDVEGDLAGWYALPFQRITLMPCYEGNYVMTVLYHYEYKDEWLISPQIDVAKGQYLTFGWYYIPLHFWVIDPEHVDFDNSVFIKREIAATMKVLVSVDGGDWVEIKDMSDEFADIDYDELSDIYPLEMMEASIPLDAYAGKNIRLAFRYVGTDGNSMFLDGVSINKGIVQADAIYMPPFTSLYVGGSREMDTPGTGIQIHPANVDLTWENFSYNEDETTYTWEYTPNLPVMEETEDVLTANFAIPTGDDNTSYDIYLAPMLTAESEGSRSNTYSEDVLLMIGGKPTSDDMSFGLLPFDIYHDGLDTYTLDPPDFGQRRVPIFGYNEATDNFWRLYTCGGKEENLPNIPYAYVSGIINAIIAPEKPLVVDGAWLYVLGKFNEKAKFTCTLYSLDEDGMLDKALASKTITGADALVVNTNITLFYYSLQFEFDHPVVLNQENTDCGLYAIAITGFHDEANVEYFAPLMQQVPNPFGIALGFYQIEYQYKGEDCVGLSHVANHYNEYGEMYCSFGINLDAHYPWLECDETTVDFTNDEVTLALRSYYPASELDVTLESGELLPAWLKVSKKGRYDKATVTLSVVDTPTPLTDNIVISAPGVKKNFKVKNLSGIEAVNIDNDDASSNANASDAVIYNLTGRRTTAPAPGFYIIRKADGSAAKLRF